MTNKNKHLLLLGYAVGSEEPCSAHQEASQGHSVFPHPVGTALHGCGGKGSGSRHKECQSHEGQREGTQYDESTPAHETAAS